MAEGRMVRGWTGEKPKTFPEPPCSNFEMIQSNRLAEEGLEEQWPKL